MLKNIQKFLAVTLLLPISVLASEVVVPIYQLNDNQQSKGIGPQVGVVKLTESAYGLLLHVDMKSISQGQHGFHVHQNPSCQLGFNDQKHAIPGLKAGGHYDPLETDKHLGPYSDEGHLGDLPSIYANSEGKIQTIVLAPRLLLSDVEGRSLMIHAHGDNYSDQPQPLGGGGARMACGVIQSLDN